jgi:signal transduction histidine kinase
MESIGRARQPNEIAPAALLDEVAAQGRARGRQVLVRTAGLPVWMRCDPAGMRLCLEILLDNAIKYTNPDTAIELIGRIASEGGVELLVRDHGPGIPEAELAKVFERGYRGGTAGEVAGSGLGLYMARSVIDVHGGTLSARNVQESGTEFRIWLPIGSGAGKALAPSGGSSDNPREAS